MKKDPADIKVVGYGLLVLYAVSILFYMEVYRRGYETRSLLATILFGLAFISTVAILRGKEWGRGLLIGVNGILGVILLWPFLISIEDFISASNILIAMIVVLFFSRPSVAILFRQGHEHDHAEAGHDTPQPAEEAAVPKGEYTKSVLVVDDDEAVLKTVRPILIKQGYAVLTASSGEDGFVIAKSQKPDLIILDVILPGIKGRDLCRKLKNEAETKGIPVVFLTAKYSQDDIKAEMEAGAQAHLTKPVNPKSLVAVVRDILNGAKN